MHERPIAFANFDHVFHSAGGRALSRLGCFYTARDQMPPEPLQDAFRFGLLGRIERGEETRDWNSVSASRFRVLLSFSARDGESFAGVAPLIFVVCSLPP
jgi:hypothetical protein